MKGSIPMKERPVPTGPGTTVGANVVLTGILRDTGDITINGKVEGELSTERSITIGETAEIKGPITAQIVTIAGLVKGSIDAGQKLEILPTGKVYGTISTRELVIRSGATFIGKSSMPTEDDSSSDSAYDQATASEREAFSPMEHAAIEEE